MLGRSSMINTFPPLHELHFELICDCLSLHLFMDCNLSHDLWLWFIWRIKGEIYSLPNLGTVSVILSQNHRPDTNHRVGWFDNELRYGVGIVYHCYHSYFKSQGCRNFRLYPHLSYFRKYKFNLEKVGKVKDCGWHCQRDNDNNYILCSN